MITSGSAPAASTLNRETPAGISGGDQTLTEPQPVPRPSATTSPNIAILLATYNGAAFLKVQLTTLLGQLDVRTHVFLRDDGSTDETLAIAAQVRAAYPGRLTILPAGESAQGSAANFFRLIIDLDPQGFDYIALADQDDIWFPNKLERAVQCLRVNACDGYSSNLLAYRFETARIWLIDKAQPQCSHDFLFQGASAGCTYVLTARAFNAVREATVRSAHLLGSRASHDWIIYAICRSHGFAWFNDPQAHILYRQHATNTYGDSDGFAGLTRRLSLSRSGWYREQVSMLKHFLALGDFERRVVEAVDRLHLADRMWLAAQVGRFRRTGRDRVLLCLSILCGWF